jgi:hypothetical protein
MKWWPNWLTIQKACLASMTIAVISFLLFIDYTPSFGLIGNVMRGDIRFQVPCSLMTTGDQSLPPGYTLIDPCWASLPYRWVLAGLFAFVSIVVVGDRRRTKSATHLLAQKAPGFLADSTKGIVDLPRAFVVRFFLRAEQKIRTLWRGDYSLPKMFWRYYVLGYLTVGIITILAGMLLSAVDLRPLGTALVLFWIIVYPLFVSVGVWRSADKSGTHWFYKLAAKLVVIAVVAIGVGRIVLVAINGGAQVFVASPN